MKDILFLNKYIKSMRIKNIFISFLYVILSFVNAIVPILLIKILDYAVQKNIKAAIITMILILMTYVVLLSLSSIIEYFSTIVKEKNKIEIIRQLIDKISKQSVKSINSDKYLSWIFNDIESIVSIYLENLFKLYYCVFLLVFSTISILYINTYMLFLMIVLTLISLIIPKIFVEKLKHIQKKLNDVQEINLLKVKNLLLGMKYFIYANKRKKAIELIRKENEKLKEASLSNFKENEIYERLMGLFNVMSTFLISTAVCILIYIGKVSFGTFFGILGIYGNFLNSFVMLVEIISKVKVGKSIFDKFELEVFEENEAKLKIDKIESINMKNISVENKLKPTSILFEKNNKYNVVGESGSGKTTLIRSLLGFENYDGNIFINNINMKNIDMKSIYDMIDYVNDDKNILLCNIYENISLFTEYDKKRIDKILELLNISHLSSYDILSKEKISTGEIARVKLARLIYNNKDILILDEAIANIDEKNREIINNYFANIDKTIIEITHHLNENLKYQVIKI